MMQNILWTHKTRNFLFSQNPKNWKDFAILRRTINNFVNPHQELNGKTQSEIAEINLNLRRNKLLELIELIAKDAIIGLLKMMDLREWEMIKKYCQSNSFA